MIIHSFMQCRCVELKRSGESSRCRRQYPMTDLPSFAYPLLGKEKAPARRDGHAHELASGSVMVKEKRKENHDLEMPDSFVP